MTISWSCRCASAARLSIWIIFLENMNLLMDYSLLFVVFLNWSQSSTASSKASSAKFDKITLTSCGPQRLASGWLDKSRLACAAKCKARYSTGCRSFMYNKTTKLCTPGGDITSTNSLTSAEGKLYYESDPQFNVVSSGSLTVNVAYIIGELNYTDAEAACQRLNSRLFVVDILGKWQLLKIIMIQRSYAWIGLDDRKNENVFVWANSSRVLDHALKTSIFQAGQPDNGSAPGANQDCVAVSRDLLELDDIECTAGMGYICERPTCQ